MSSKTSDYPNIFVGLNIISSFGSLTRVKATFIFLHLPLLASIKSLLWTSSPSYTLLIHIWLVVIGVLIPLFFIKTRIRDSEKLEPTRQFVSSFFLLYLYIALIILAFMASSFYLVSHQNLADISWIEVSDEIIYLKMFG